MEAFRTATLAVVGLFLVVMLGAAAVYVLSEMRLSQRAPVRLSAGQVAIPTDIASIQRGQHLVGAVALCTQCHGANFGGMVLQDDRAARIVAPNLTRGGVGGTLAPEDAVRAIRDGFDPAGRQLWSMPSDNYSVLSDADVGAIVAYLQALPPIATSLPAPELRPLGRVLLVTDQWPLLTAADANASPRVASAPDPGLTPEYGAYLATLAGCGTCHTSAAGREWSESDFTRAMRTGRRPDGRPLASSMPWPYFAQMSDLELGAIWQYLQSTAT